MWAIIKFDNKKIGILKSQIKKKLGNETKFYLPKLSVEKFRNNKLVKKEFYLLGNYLFCYNVKFIDEENFKFINYITGLKYILKGVKDSQNDVEKFINECQKSENKDGYLTSSFFTLIENKNYVFKSGPFSEKIFNVINLQKNKIDLLLGNLKTRINKKKLLFSPL